MPLYINGLIIFFVAEPFLDRPRWGLLKVYSHELPPDHVYFLHNQTTTEMPAILIQLWPPKSRVVFTTRKLVLNAEETAWGLLGLASDKLNVEGIIVYEVEMEEGETSEA